MSPLAPLIVDHFRRDRAGSACWARCRAGWGEVVPSAPPRSPAVRTFAGLTNPARDAHLLKRSCLGKGGHPPDPAGCGSCPGSGTEVRVKGQDRRRALVPWSWSLGPEGQHKYVIYRYTWVPYRGPVVFLRARGPDPTSPPDASSVLKRSGPGLYLSCRRTGRNETVPYRWRHLGDQARICTTAPYRWRRALWASPPYRWRHLACAKICATDYRACTWR